MTAATDTPEAAAGAIDRECPACRGEGWTAAASEARAMPPLPV